MPVESAEQRLNAAVLTLAYLGRCGERGYVAHREIAQKHNLATRDVVSLMHSLADAGLVDTRLGRQGGVSISKPLSQISIRELYEACKREDEEDHGEEDHEEKKDYRTTGQRDLEEERPHDHAITRPHDPKREWHTD